MIRLGLRLHDAEKLPLEQMLPLVREKGFVCAHVALGKLFKDIPCTPAALTPGYAHYLRRIFEQNGLDIALLGNYLNLLHPDGSYLKDAYEKYYAHIRFASLLGCGMVGTETGAPNAEYKFTPECRSEKTLLLFATQAGHPLRRKIRRDRCHRAGGAPFRLGAEGRPPRAGRDRQPQPADPVRPGQHAGP